MMPAEGAKAPEFSAVTDTGETLTLKSLRGKYVVLYFYPKDDTPGCTTEACSFRDDFPDFTKLNAVVLGVSKDSVKSHQKFKTKYKLPFTLLSDPEHAVADAYGVWGEKKFMGRSYMGMSRSTFVIGPDGKIIKVFEKATPKDHATEVAAAIRGG